jgi:UDP-2-acetamido-3-amino-2,3-dideoxy-glucuronate N-acetyltransferase
MVFTHISFPRAAVNRRATFAKTIVKTGVTLGANSTVVPGITIGMGCFLAAGSTLTKDAKAWSLMVGSPARHIGWVSAFGEKIPLPLTGEGQWACPHTGDVYVLDNDIMSREPGAVDILKYEPGKKLERMQTEAPDNFINDPSLGVDDLRVRSTDVEVRPNLIALRRTS